MATNYNSKVLWRAKEFSPNANQIGMSHSWFAEAYCPNTVSNSQLAKLVEARTGLRAYEVEAAIKGLCEVIYEECMQSMRVYLTDNNDDKFISIEPKVAGSISDAMVVADAEKYNGATVATEAMLAELPKSITLGATVGVNASKKFALSAKLQKYTGNSDGGDSEGGDTPEPGTTYALSLESEAGIASVNGSGNYASGASVTVTATVASGETFDGWYEGTTKRSTNLSYTFTMPAANLTLKAKVQSGDEMEP